MASISFLAIPTLIDRAMQEEVRAGRLADVTVALRSIRLTDEQLATVAVLPNVAAAEARSSVDVRALVGERRAPARVVGVRDFARQSVDVVRVDSGAFPGSNQLLADVQDANVGVYDGRAGDRLTVLARGGKETDFGISGRGRTLPGGEQVQDDNVIVFYGSTSTVAALSGETGYDELALRLDDPSPNAARQTVEDVRRYLTTVPGFTGFADLPEVRAPGDWPGKVGHGDIRPTLERDHDPGFALGSGLDLEHDEHARGGADTRDRDYACGRCAPPPGDASFI